MYTYKNQILGGVLDSGIWFRGLGAKVEERIFGQNSVNGLIWVEVT